MKNPIQTFLMLCALWTGDEVGENGIMDTFSIRIGFSRGNTPYAVESTFQLKWARLGQPWFLVRNCQKVSVWLIDFHLMGAIQRFLSFSGWFFRNGKVFIHVKGISGGGEEVTPRPPSSLVNFLLKETYLFPGIVFSSPVMQRRKRDPRIPVVLCWFNSDSSVSQSVSQWTLLLTPKSSLTLKSCRVLLLLVSVKYPTGTASKESCKDQSVVQFT